MATKKIDRMDVAMAKANDPRHARPQQEPQNGAGEAKATQDVAEAGPARKTAPIAPRVTSGNSPLVVTRIREAIASAVYSKQDGAIAAAIEAIEAVPTIKAHPQVAVYKAEAIDYLRSKLK